MIKWAPSNGYVSFLVSQRFYLKNMLWKVSEDSEVSIRGNHLVLFLQIYLPKSFTDSHEKNIFWSLFLIRLTSWMSATSLEIGSSTGFSAFCVFAKLHGDFFAEHILMVILARRCFYSVLQIWGSRSKSRLFGEAILH